MPKITHIFFDFRGVVAKLNSKKFAYNTQMAAAYVMPKKDFVKVASQYLSQFKRGEITESIFWKKLSDKLGVSTPKIVKKLFHQPLSNYATLYKSIVHFVTRLQKLGYICVILSDDNVAQSSLIKKSGWYKPFDELLISYATGISKYDDVMAGTNKVFGYVLKKYKIQPDQALFIDDREENCEVAKRRKIKGILAKGPRQVIRDIKKILSIT